jgi:Ca2+-binding RTX toxin-like protein
MPYSITSYTLPDSIEDGIVKEGTQTGNLVGNISDNSLTGNDGRNTFNAGLGNDYLIGGLGIDHLNGGGGDDVIYTETTDSSSLLALRTAKGAGGSNASSANRNYANGGAGNDSITGGDSTDILDGGIGNDKLTGKAGSDSFKLSSQPNALTNLDTITDFQPSIDKIQLSKAIFTAFTSSGTIDTKFFISGADVVAAVDNYDHLIYDSTTGELFYDADASGVAFDPIQIALLATAPTLTSVDFSII